MASVGAVLSVGALTVTFSLATLGLQFILFKKSLAERWSESSPLTLLLLSNIAASFVYIFVSLQWALIALGVISNHIGFVFLLPVAFAYSFTAFHDFATIGLFLQRIHFILVPTVNVKRTNKEISKGVLIASGAVSLLELVLHSSHFDASEEILRTCNSYCLDVRSAKRIFELVFYLILLPLVIVLLGATFAFLYRRFKSENQSNRETMMHSYILCLFIPKIFLKVLPGTVDLFLLVFDMKLAQFTGPYSPCVSSVIYFLTTFLYVIMQRKESRPLQPSQ